MGGSSSNTEEKEEEPTMDTSTQMTENLSGFHILEIHMPSMGTGRRLLLLVGAAVLALRWWVQRRHAKKMWLKGGVPQPGLRDGLPVPALPPLLPTCRPVLDAWGGRDRGPVRGAALGSSWSPLLPPAAPLGAWAGPAVAPGGRGRRGGRARPWAPLRERKMK